MNNKTKNKSTKRIRRSKEQRETPIQIQINEFELLISYLNIISNSLVISLKEKLSYRIMNIKNSIIKPNKISQDVLMGISKIQNKISIDIVSDDIDVKDIFLEFAKNNRYLNITKTRDSIKAENSDKYPYFNIEMKLGYLNYKFNIYSRRCFSVVRNTKKHKKRKLLIGDYFRKIKNILFSKI